MHTIFPTARLRPSPFYEAAVAEGMKTVSIYNSMILPASYGDPEGEYWRLMRGVSQWDVGAERQVELCGPDAGTLAQMLAVRDLSNMKEGQGKYVAVCDHHGTIINDPICLKHADDHYWFSIADHDMWTWARAVAAERGLDVTVREPDVSPMAIQGPKAEDVVAAVCGDWVRELKYFWFRETEIEDIPVAVQRSGWSKQGGFEIYLMDGTRGRELWNIFREAGQPFGIGPGAPTTPERTESGFVSVGGDTDDWTSPFDVRMDRFVDLDVPDDTIGVERLRRIQAEGPARRQWGIRLEGDRPAPLGFAWERITKDGREIGSLTNCVWSFRFERNIGYALVERDLLEGDEVEVQRAGGPVKGRLCALPFA